MNFKAYIAELIGTFVLVVFGCGVAVLSGVDLVATSLAFGLVIVAMAYSIGNISGCHINPAVSLAMLITKKMNATDFAGYVIAQILGATLGAVVLGLFTTDFQVLGGNAAQAILVLQYNETGALFVALLAEIVLTFVFVMAILGVTSKTENKSVTGVVIGLALTLVHLLGVNLTGTSVNPARSIGPAIVQAIAGDATALSQIWIFIIGPLAGAAIAALVYMVLDKKKVE
ncbi:MAG: aquaporin [Clostridia bacterium]|nr:aquaporin [Clostridia bacterium]